MKNKIIILGIILLICLVTLIANKLNGNLLPLNPNAAPSAKIVMTGPAGFTPNNNIGVYKPAAPLLPKFEVKLFGGRAPLSKMRVISIEEIGDYPDFRVYLETDGWPISMKEAESIARKETRAFFIKNARIPSLSLSAKQFYKTPTNIIFFIEATLNYVNPEGKKLGYAIYPVFFNNYRPMLELKSTENPIPQ